jgi:hypothetical protein
MAPAKATVAIGAGNASPTKAKVDFFHVRWVAVSPFVAVIGYDGAQTILR